MVRHRQNKRKIIAHGSVGFCDATPIVLVDELKKSGTGARRTETCVVPRHVDVSRDFYFVFVRTSSVGGGGGRFSLFFYFSCLADHERDWPVCKVVFRVANQYVEYVRNNNINIIRVAQDKHPKKTVV